MYNEEEKFEELMSILAMSGEFQESELEYHVHEIMDNPHIYPEYFWWRMTTPNWQHHSRKEQKRTLKPQAMRQAKARRKALKLKLTNARN